MATIQSEDGSLPRDVVIQVLTDCGIDIGVPSGTPPAGTLPLYKLATKTDPAGTLQNLPLPNPISKRMIQYLSRVFGVQIHYFYNPDMVPKKK